MRDSVLAPKSDYSFLEAGELNQMQIFGVRFEEVEEGTELSSWVLPNFQIGWLGSTLVLWSLHPLDRSASMPTEVTDLSSPASLFQRDRQHRSLCCVHHLAVGRFVVGWLHFRMLGDGMPVVVSSIPFVGGPMPIE